MPGFELDNPYFAELAGSVTVGPNREGFRERHVRARRRRDDLVQEFAWGIPNQDAIRTIAAHGPILEVGAGAGYWAWLLRQADVDVIATDKDAPAEEPWTPVWAASAQDVVTDYPDRTLLMVWPTSTSNWPTAALGAYQGETLIYVGEGRNGCTAGEPFHRMLYDDWQLEKAVDIPTYFGFRDRLEVWRRTP